MLAFCVAILGEPGSTRSVPATRTETSLPSMSSNCAPTSILKAQKPPFSPASSKSPRNSLADPLASTRPSHTASTTTGVSGSSASMTQPCADVPCSRSKYPCRLGGGRARNGLLQSSRFVPETTMETCRASLNDLLGLSWTRKAE